MQDILVIGGGFAGVWAALGASAARRERPHAAQQLRIRLVSREPYLTIRPRLYEADLSGVRVPLEGLLDSLGVSLVVGDVERMDTRSRLVTVRTTEGSGGVHYDRLILAAGSRLRRPDVPGAREHAFTVDTWAEAMTLERHLNALAEGSGTTVEGQYTAVIVGAGFTGIEVATTMISRLRELARRAGSSARPRVVLVDRAHVVARDLGESSRPVVEKALAELGIELRLGAGAARVTPHGVTLTDGESLAAATTVWTGGLCASDLTLQLEAERDALGRLPVDDFLRVRGVKAVFAAGDVARVKPDGEHVAPMSCQFAIPMGEAAGRNAVAELTGGTPQALQRPHYVTCVDLGEWGGLFTEGWGAEREVRLAGFWGKQMKETINTRLIYPPAPLVARVAPAA